VRQEFDAFVARSADPLLRAAYLITWDSAEAEDLVQDVLCQVARAWPRVRRMEFPHAYARRVLVNRALSAGPRRMRRRTELDATVGALEGLSDRGAELSLSSVELAADLQCALGALAPRQRTTLVLRYFEDLPEAEVARLLGCSVGTVKSTTSRALERLREVVEHPRATDIVEQTDQPGTRVPCAMERSTTR